MVVLKRVDCIFLCIPTYNVNYCQFEIKPVVPRTSNLRDSAVYSILKYSKLMGL